MFASDASVKGSIVLANSGTEVMSGSSIAAGAQAATLKLERGGTMMICPGTNLAVTTSQNGRQLMFSMDTGNLEMDYPIGAASDNLLTPDFRLLLPGPGRLHIAVRVSPKGDTCVQSLPSNSSAIVISEGMGDASYQVKPNEAVIFNGGHISGATPTRESCGCPAPPPTQVAKAHSSTRQPKPSRVAATGAGNAHGGGCPIYLSRFRSGRSHRERRAPQDGEQADELCSGGATATCVGKKLEAGECSSQSR